MAQQTINVGAAPNDGTGTPLRTAFQYTNSNFTELYTALGGGSGLPGATTQVIFNDGGTNLAGDAGLVYNKTTDALTIGGNVQAASATISGDLTVDTSTLKVDSANNRVGIGTATPSATFSALIGSEFLHFGFGANNDNYYTVGASGTHIWRSSSTERMRIDSSGNVGIGVTPSAGKGCLQLSSGINFPATQVASSDANTLDDYEEGTFTPTIVGTTGAGTGTYTTQLGRYTKVGRIVTCDISLVWTAHDGTGNIDIGGLPFSVLNTTGYAASATIGYIDNIALTAGHVPMAVLWWFNTTKIRLNQTPTGGGAAAGVPMDSAGQINLSITYIVA